MISFTFELITLPEQVKCFLERDYRTGLLSWRGLAGGVEVESEHLFLRKQ